MAKGYFTTRLLVAGRERFLAFPCPLDAHIEWIQGRKYIRNRAGHILAIPSDQELHSELTTKHKCFDFEVLYVGQSFGDEGDRDAIDRLLKHETLQKISILENKAGHTLAVLLLSLPRHHSSITLINPRAADTTQNEARIGIGLQNSNVATERDRVTLFEASLIRHFRPEYNEKFKDSFPSTKTKALKECYNKDILSVIAEISFPEIPFRIYSQHVRPEKYVFINHNLHSDSDRRLYFFDEPSGR
ncbi:hypothetical protein [Tabrizicola sp.]|uniref:hypothetical protein n=1 Tax=Tabrizicola sp. TaxID=2005166 RepID=UPI0035B01D68